jgi:hypothetical protein
MAIEFKLPETIEKQLRGVQLVAENVMRPRAAGWTTTSMSGRSVSST